VAVIERTDAGSVLAFDIEIDPLAEVPVSASNLAEMLGALIENAARFARRRVALYSAEARMKSGLSSPTMALGMNAGRIDDAQRFALLFLGPDQAECGALVARMAAATHSAEPRS
jgi:hypothetical protein